MAQMNADGSAPDPAPIKVPFCSGLPQTGTKWNLEVPFRTTRLRGSLPIRRAQVCLGFLYRTLKHTYKPQVRAAVKCQAVDNTNYGNPEPRRHIALSTSRRASSGVLPKAEHDFKSGMSAI